MVTLVSQDNGVAVFQGGGQQLTIDANCCIICTQCESVCAYSAIAFQEGYAGDGNYEALVYIGMQFRTGNCDMQGDCVSVCPMNALDIQSTIPDPPDEFGPGEGATPLRDITNNLTTPCLGNVFNQINNSDSLGTDIGHILHDVFDIWDQANLTIGESTSLPSNENGHTNSTASGAYFNADIVLNANTLPVAAKEYIAGTIYHEIIHAYLNYTGQSGNMNNHTQMTLDYMNAIKSTLQYYYPGLSSTAAEAIAWVGLDATTAWAALQTNDPTKYNQIISLQDSYRAGTSGTPCP